MLELTGRIDTNNAAQVEKELQEQLAAQNETQLVFDAAGLEYISSAGLRVLLRVRKQYPDIRISEDPRIMDSYTLIRSFEDGHIGLVPPHVSTQFLPLKTVPLKMDMSWPVGLVYREPRSAVISQFIEVARQVFLQQ